MGKRKTLLDEYRFRGFRPRAEVNGIFGEPDARIIRLERVQKKRFAASAVVFTRVFTTGPSDGFGTFPVETPGSSWTWRFAG
jgi:hypothetical protein